MFPGGVLGLAGQQIDHRAETIMAGAGHDGGRHKEPEIMRFEDLQVLPVGARLPAGLGNEPQSHTARDQRKLNVVALYFRAKIEMATLTIKGTLQGRSESTSPRVEHPRMLAKLRDT